MLRVSFLFFLCATFALTSSENAKAETIDKTSKVQQKCLEWQNHAAQYKSDREEICKKLNDDFQPSSAEPKEFPHQVIFGNQQDPDTTKWQCGGSLISDQWVLTAAHCMVYFRGKQIKAKMALKFENDDSHVYNVTQFVLHPSYTASSAYDDIAVVQLDEKVKLTEEVFPICLDDVGLEPEKALLIGWNSTSFRSMKPEEINLKKGVVSKFSFEDSNDVYPANRRMPSGINNETQIFYGSKVAGYESCWGTSGNSLQVIDDASSCSYKLIGLTLFGKGCGEEVVPDGFQRIQPYVKWIESVVWP